MSYSQFHVVQASPFSFLGTPLANPSWIYINTHTHTHTKKELSCSSSFEMRLLPHAYCATPPSVIRDPALIRTMHQAFIRGWHLILWYPPLWISVTRWCVTSSLNCLHSFCVLSSTSEGATHMREGCGHHGDQWCGHTHLSS